MPIGVFSQVGNVGIDTNNPQEKLHVKGSIRYQSTNPSYPVTTGKTLVSDASGNANWQNINLSKPTIFADYNSTSYNKVETFSAYTLQTSTSPYRTTGTSITLPTGKWLIIVSLGAYIDNKGTAEITYYPMKDGRNTWMKTSFFDDNTDGLASNASKPSPDIYTSAVYSSNSIIGPNPNGLITGEFFINQKSATPKTYYLKYIFEYYSPQATNVRITNFACAPELVPENFIAAYPINF